MPAAGKALRFAPSEKQQALFARRTVDKAPGLVCLLNYRAGCDDGSFAASIEAAVSAVRGSIRWQGRVQGPINDASFNWQEALLLDLPDAPAWEQLQSTDEWRQAQALLDGLEIRVGLMSAGFARALPILHRILRLLPLSKTPSKIPVTREFVSDLDPIETRYRALRDGKPLQPIVILNFHKYREQSVYPKDDPFHGAGGSGRKAYLRYGLSAIRIVLGRGNRLLFAGSYAMTLVGNGGEPAPGLYDEITLMQYKSGAEFAACFELRSMEGTAGHRRAGLEHCMIAVTEPAGKYVAR